MAVERQEDDELEATGAEDRRDDSFQIQLPMFEGPLDLLLHLIREHQLDVFDIPISFVTERYLAHIELMKVLNLDVAGEFLLMAATLAHIKSKMLLPRPEVDPEADEVEELDPRAELVRRLLEYQKYKEAGNELGQQPLLGRDVFSRDVRPGPLPRPEGDLGLQEVTVFALVTALDRVMKRAEIRIPHQVFVEKITVIQRMSELQEKLRLGRRLTFTSLLLEGSDREMIVTTFLAVLELARLGEVRIHQLSSEGEIFVSPASGPRPVEDLA